MQDKKKFRLRYILIPALTISVLYGGFCSYVVMMRTLHSVAQSQMEQIANEAIHNAIGDCAANPSKYGELVNICRNKDGAIESLSLNPHAVNMMKSDISIKVLEYLNDSDKYVIEVPLGNFFASEFLSGLGPKIKLEVVPFNVAGIDFESKFTPAGINQVLHTVSVKVDVKIGALLTGFEEICDISSTAIISESVIIGDVPQTYLDF